MHAATTKPLSLLVATARRLSSPHLLRRFHVTPVATLLLLLALQAVASAQLIQVGDYVTTVTETPAKANADVVAELPRTTTFRVVNIQGDWLNIQDEVDGKDINAWVRQRDVLKLPADCNAIGAAANIIKPQSFRFFEFRAPSGVEIAYSADGPVDVFVVDKQNLDILKDDSRSGQFTAAAAKTNARNGVLSWKGHSEYHYFVVDNSDKYPRDGAHAGRPVSIKHAFCEKAQRPAAMISTRGLLLGRVIIEYDGYDGRTGRHHGPLNVDIACLDGEENETFTAKTDADGYFFLDNVKVNRKYRVDSIRIGNGTVSFGQITSLFRKDKEKDKWIEDLGIYRAVVHEGGKLDRTILTEEVTVTSDTTTDGGTKLAFDGGTRGLPLECHDWFIETFPDSDWIPRVVADRDAIYEARKKKKKEKGTESKATPDKKEPAFPVPPVKGDETVALSPRTRSLP